MRMIAIAMLAGLSACSFNSGDDRDGPGVAGSGSGSARSFQVADFTTIDLRGSDDVDVRVGTGFSVRAEGPAAELDRLRIAKDGSTLTIGRINGKGMSWGKRDKVTVYVTLPRLAGADVAGSGTMSVDRVEGARFTASVAGSGTLAVATMTVDAAVFSIAGSGDAKVAGTTKQLQVDMAGSGSLDGAALTASQASVSVAGSGNVRATVNGTAKVNVMGSGDVDLGRDADCSVTKMGSGSVRCR
jgi:hypothetical protein